MPSPHHPPATDGLVLPARRARRLAGQLAVVFILVAGLVALELLIVFIVAALIRGGGSAMMRAPGVWGYLGLPVIVVAFSVPFFALSWRQSALRIDAAGVGRLRRDKAETVSWADVEAVRFSRRGGILILQVRAGATLPHGRRTLNRSVALPFHALGNALLQRRHRRARHDRIVAAVERFAPGKFTDSGGDVSAFGRPR